MADENELGQFLRSRRAEITPAQAGVPDAGDRRVPGLRREEVALLAGLSTDYYTRLEQGRERRPSDQVLDALAAVLLLEPAAVDYLFRLAQPAPSHAGRVQAAEPGRDVVDFVLNDVAVPATVTDAALTVLAANDAACALYRPFGRFDNIVRMIFLDPVARDFYGDWDMAARGVVANLRAAAAPFPDDPTVTALVGELTMRSPAFVQLWARREVRPRNHEHKLLHHPDVGDLHLRYQAFDIGAAPGQQLFVYTAEPGSTDATRLALLTRVRELPDIAAIREDHPS